MNLTGSEGTLAVCHGLEWQYLLRLHVAPEVCLPTTSWWHDMFIPKPLRARRAAMMPRRSTPGEGPRDKWHGSEGWDETKNNDVWMDVAEKTRRREDRLDASMQASMEGKRPR